MIRYVLQRQVHVSWMVASACGGIVTGVILAREFPLFVSVAWLLTGTALFFTAALRARLGLAILAIFGGMFIGLWRGSIVQSDLTGYQPFLTRTISITGTISEDVDTNPRGQSVIRLRNVTIEAQKLPGSIWLTANDAPALRRSDHITATGRLNEGFGSFAGSVYGGRISAVERPVPGDVALTIRDHFGGGVREVLGDTEASLGLGYLVGQRRGLPQDLNASLQAAGLTHIVVASGYNLTILVRLARRLFERVSKYLSLLASVTMIVGFIAITGLSPSMSRAGLIAGLSILAWYYGRRFHPLVLLPFAMAITLMVQPSYAWGDLGWQLSFAAFGGVMILAPLLQVYFYGDTQERALRRIFIETISATVATLPLLLISFGQISVVAPIANMLVLPLVPLAMLLTLIAGIAGLILPSVIAIVFGWPAQIILTYMVGVAHYMGGLSWALQDVQLGPLGAVLLYLVIVLACVYMSWSTKYDLRGSSLVE